MPPRSRRSPTRRPKSGGAHAGRISGSPITATSSRASEAGAAAKRRRADRRLNAISAESGCIDRNRNKGVRKSFADTATPTHLGTPSTPARATPITSAGNRETDEDETDTSQRFSNVSGWQHARETTPPNPTPTSPCTPADSRAAEQAAHAASAQRGGSAALSMDHDRVFEQSLYGASSAAHPPPATSSASSQPVRPFSAELLSQLLMAEAARAEAAATAGQHDGNSSDGGDYATVGPRYALPEPQLPVPVMATTTTEWCGYRRDSGTASPNEQGGEATLSAAASRLVLPTDCLTVCVGVVPLPGCEASSEGTACRKRSRWWPWSRTVSVVRSDAADGVVGEAASDPANHDSKKCGGATKATWLASLRNQAVSVLQLRPRNLYTSGQQRTAVAVDSRSASTILAPSSGATTTDFTETAVSISPTLGIGPTTAVRGWTGVFADVPIVLPGAQLACSVDAPATAMNACTEAHARGGGLGGRLQSEAVVCSAAASISVVLA
ncbi:hypothetical protein LSCM1_07189 [Leishmania martiniquensis]|uniref:Uncharacterized protein n=1 Tax=Leishmania martiniquensis TaxID=1580590 RepID=A0A836HGI8_9TRYP|nr:hypothetical protein LSCM1_07189 [Leishmania martiniquensis]